MLGTREHYLTDCLGQVFLFTSMPQADNVGAPRSPDVIACWTYARYTLEDIARGQQDPFHYRLLGLWLDVFREPWAQPADLDGLIDDLAEAIASGEVLVYRHEDPLDAYVGSSGAGKLDADSKDSAKAYDETDEQRTQENLPYTPNPEYAEPKAGNRIHRRKHPDGTPEDPYTIQADDKPLGAEEGPMPASLKGLREKPPNHDALQGKGWPNLDYKDKETYKTFTDAKPVDLKPGTKIYRIVDERAGDAGGFWSYELPESKAEWRRDFAVKDEWNDNGYYVEHVVGNEGLKAWEGPAAGQPYQEANGREFYLEGGQKQLFITPGKTEPSAPKLTNWPEP